jgi:putative mRNA 3-end processing factor
MSANPILRLTEAGLYCEPGDFFIDPWRRVERAVITHAHADHARRGCGSYLTSDPGKHPLQLRMGADALVQSIAYGEAVRIRDVTVSLHPAGHVLGSAQIRIEHSGYVAVVSGDYKVDHDPTCASFESVKCHLFITESTFGLPIYRWARSAEVFAAIDSWRIENQAAGKASLLLAYSLGKAQRILASVDRSIGPIFAHGAVEAMNRAYRSAGVELPEIATVQSASKGFDWSKALIVAPPSAWGSPWARRFGEVSTAVASGWMTIRGTRRRRGVDRGFVISDHADWPGLLGAIEATGASEVWVTHGYSAVVARLLLERGIDAKIVSTRFEGERIDSTDDDSLSDNAAAAVSTLTSSDTIDGENGSTDIESSRSVVRNEDAGLLE